MKNICCVAILFFLSFSSFAGELKISSIPKGAVVSIVGLDGKVVSKLGVTPVEFDVDDLLSRLKTTDVIHLVLEKKHHQRERVLIPLKSGKNYSVAVKLDVLNVDHKVEYIDTLVAGLFDIQKMIRVKDYDSALTVLARLEGDYPYYSIVPELKGSVQYLNKDFKESLGSFRKAVGLNPKNHDAFRMKVYLEKYMGIKKSPL